MQKDLKTKIDKWVTKIGSKEAEIELMRAGISGSTAQKLIKGAYPSQPKHLVLQAIESAMKKGA